MEILASCSLEESKEKSGKLVIAREDKKSADKVTLNVVVRDGDQAVFKNLTGNERCVTFIDNPVSTCPEEWKGKVFNEYPFGIDYSSISEVDGVISLIRLPKAYSDMRTLKDINKDYPNLRFIGGNLLGIEGVNIGRYEQGKSKMSPVFSEMYDTFLEVPLSELDNIEELVRRNKRKVTSMSDGKRSGKGRGSGSSKNSFKREAIKKLFDSVEEEEF